MVTFSGVINRIIELDEKHTQDFNFLYDLLESVEAKHRGIIIHTNILHLLYSKAVNNSNLIYFI